MGTKVAVRPTPVGYCNSQSSGSTCWPCQLRWPGANISIRRRIRRTSGRRLRLNPARYSRSISYSTSAAFYVCRCSIRRTAPWGERQQRIVAPQRIANGNVLLRSCHQTNSKPNIETARRNSKRSDLLATLTAVDSYGSRNDFHKILIIEKYSLDELDMDIGYV